MERLEMSIQSLLLLVIAIQVTNSCKCKPRTMEEAMNESDTVVMAIVDYEALVDDIGETTYLESMAVSAKYDAYVTKSYKNGSNALFVNNRPYFDVVLPRKETNCGDVLTVGWEYILSGTVKTAGILDVDKCELILPVRDITYDYYDTTDDYYDTTYDYYDAYDD